MSRLRAILTCGCEIFIMKKYAKKWIDNPQLKGVCPKCGDFYDPAQEKVGIVTLTRA